MNSNFDLACVQGGLRGCRGGVAALLNRVKNILRAFGDLGQHDHSRRGTGVAVV